MELYKEILITALENQKIEVYFPELKIDSKNIVELKCYDALKQIKEVLEDSTIDDTECFNKIEKIVCIFEKTCGGVNFRHDF